MRYQLQYPDGIWAIDGNIHCLTLLRFIAQENSRIFESGKITIVPLQGFILFFFFLSYRDSY